MEREARNTNGSRWILVLAVGLATLVAPLSPVARAQVAEDGGGTEEVWYGETDVPGEEIERWWGVVGAAICGAEIRIIRVAPAIGMNPYMIAAGLGGCLLAVLDVVTS